jgi:hypothetical protein
MAVILSGANGSLYFSCGVYGTSGKIQGFFPFGFAQGQNDDRRIDLNENGLSRDWSMPPPQRLGDMEIIFTKSINFQKYLKNFLT